MNTLHKTLLLSSIVLTPVAHAQDSWTSPDKALHFGLTAGGSAVCTIVTGWTKTCIGAGVGVAVLKEIYDSRHKDVHTPSVKDFIAGSLGAVVGGIVGEKVRGMIIIPKKDGIKVSYNMEF